MTITENFGLAVRATRKKRGITQTSLAKTLKMKQAQLSRIECGTYHGSITNDLAERIASALKCRVDVLLKDNS